jgi:hypothetical protein
LAFVVFGLIVLVLFPWYRFLIGPDAISYFSIAHDYARGDWLEAINVNWGPLYCWLLAPLIRFGVADASAGRLVCVLSGFLVLYAVSLWTRRLELSGLMEFAVMASAAVMTASYALIRMGPDLLLAALLLFYWLIVHDRQYPRVSWSGPVCGLLGGLLFLSKSYGGVFFAGHFLFISAVLLLFSEKRGAILRHAVLGLAVFALVAGSWVLAMSHKAGFLTTGSTATWNYRLVGPDSLGYPQYGRLILPPETHSASMWERPDPELLPAWKATGSLREFRHQLRLIAVNGRDLFNFTREISMFAPALLLVYVVLGWSGRLRGECPWWMLAVTLATYPAAYLLVLVQDRYLWAWFLLILLAGAAVLQSVGESRSLPALPAALLLTAFTLSFLIMPAEQMIAQRHSGQNIHQLKEKILGSAGKLSGDAASCSHWNDSLALAYQLGLRFDGTTGMDADEALVGHSLNPSLPPGSARKPESSAGIARDLSADHVNYYFAWTNCESVPAAVTAQEEITGGRIPELRVYRLQEPRP